MSDRLRKKKRRASSSRRPRQETKLPQEEGAADKVAENKAAENKHVTPASITLTRYIWEHVPELASLMSFDAFTSAVLASRAIVHDDTLTARLGPDIMTSILIDFLDVDTRTKLRSCARALHQRIPASIRFELKDQHWGDFGGADHVIDYIRLPQCLSSLVARVEWKDQGWGNRKGQLFLTLERNGNDVARQDVFGIAEHTWSTAEAILDTKSAVVFRSRAGDTLKICTHVGGGGGHRLEVKSLSITAGCSTSAEADRRNRHDRAREAKLAPFLAWTAAVQDDQFSASSEWDQQNRTSACHFSRLDSFQPSGRSSAWCAGFNDNSQWIQVDLRKPHVVTAVATQGRGDCAQWVSEYTLSTSLDGKLFVPFRDDSVFVGNEDQTSVVVHQLERYAAYGRYLRLHPRAWHGHLSMRWAVLARPATQRDKEAKQAFAAAEVKARFRKPSPVQVLASGAAALAPYLAWTAAVQDDQFSASSAWDQRNRTHACHFCRLDSLHPARGHSSAWCAGFNDDRQWIQVDLREPHVVTAIATQGRGDCAQWVSEYTLSTSLDGKVFVPLRDDPIFVGNEDQTSVVVHRLERYAAYGRYLRLHPRAWHGHISMRWAVLAHPATPSDEEVKQAFAAAEVKARFRKPSPDQVLASRAAALAPFLAWTAAVQDDQFSASSEWDQQCRTHACHFCRLESLQPARGHSSAWCAGFNDNRQWIQVDLREPHVVTAVATQGRRDCAQWVSEYTLSTSLDGKVFIPLRDDPIFVGNEDQTSVVVHQLERYAAYGRYLRLHPRAWHGHISMRWAVLACPAMPSDEEVKQAFAAAEAALAKLADTRDVIAA